MALVMTHPTGDRKRVKVYELRNSDWFDRGTGFCVGQVLDNEPRIYVESEDQPERTLLETKITKDDSYQKQQATLIVWNEPGGPDMALSFQEAEGCAVIWDFVSGVQQQLIALAGPGLDDTLSEDAVDSLPNPIMLPSPELRNLPDIEQVVRAAYNTPQGRDSLAKFILAEDYISRLLPLISIAEDLESLPDLHRLCNIMKSIILLNDTTIMEHIVTDELILGVVGALEYDPDFPSHKANHRHYLTHRSKFKEVVQIQDEMVRKKIHYTYRLQYLKDVVLARILDDPTFSVLNSLIFYNQVEIVQHLQANVDFISELFLVFGPGERNPQRKKDGVLFIQQCCAIAKNIQAPARTQLYSHFIQNDVLKVITLALKHQDPSVRIAGTDVLVALIDHDPAMMRSLIFKQINDEEVPLTDTLVELLLREVDFGVKAQVADTLKVLLDPATSNSTVEAIAKASTETTVRVRPNSQTNPQAELFIQHFYEQSAKKLFGPLKELEFRPSIRNFTSLEVALYTHIVEILNFFVRQHYFRSKFFILSHNLAARIGQLMACPEKHLKLTALKFFRTCIGMQDDFYVRQLVQYHLFVPVLDLVYETMPRDNLLNSACLELFEFIKRETIKPLIAHIVENYRERLEGITYVDTFETLILRYEQMQCPDAGPNSQSMSTQEDESIAARQQQINGGGTRWQGVREMDALEEEYFNTSDDEEDDVFVTTPTSAPATPRRMTKDSPNGNGALLGTPNKPLVDYPEEDDEEAEEDSGSDPMDVATAVQPFSSVNVDGPITSSSRRVLRSPSASIATALDLPTPPERLAEKRRRQADEDDDDELIKLSHSKRRSSSASSVGSFSTSSASSTSHANTAHVSSSVLRRRKSFNSSSYGTNAIADGSVSRDGGGASIASASVSGGGSGGGGPVGKRIAISLAINNGGNNRARNGNATGSGAGSDPARTTTGGSRGGGVSDGG